MLLLFCILLLLFSSGIGLFQVESLSMSSDFLCFWRLGPPLLLDIWKAYHYYRGEVQFVTLFDCFCHSVVVDIELLFLVVMFLWSSLNV
ncbi:hypothetical protein RchiOBHm_Chr4g0415401 [Rosa chinensis]|uniref:Uncharacterized protein n=1 Tax=Rosa chinensis TaxID=74649 RepID=A0A2P6QWM0_ROSCH|nr:hypothetical protein RchiOBHm_Chr4g0415401 [Rosa chinensis]